MNETDLTTTLRIAFDAPDLAAAEDKMRGLARTFGDELASQIQRALGSAGKGTGDAKGGGVTRSPADADGGAGAAPGGSGGGGGRGGRRGGRSDPAPGDGTKNPSDLDDGGGGGGGASGRRKRDERGKFTSGIDYRDYLAGPSVSRDARTMVGALADPVRGGISMLTSHFGDRVMDAAKMRAEEIDAAKRAGDLTGISVGGTSMGALRFAGPIGAAATVGGQLLAAHIGKGLDLQEQYSTRFGSQAQMLATINQAGLSPDLERFGSQAAARSTQAWHASKAMHGAQNWDEMVATQFAYSSAAMGGRSRMGDAGTPSWLRLMQLKGAGITDEAIAAYATPGRIGATNADPYRLVGAGQAAGLSPTVISSLLQQVAQNTHAIASRGIKVDMDASTAWIEKAVSLGKSPEVSREAYENARGGIAATRDQFLSPMRAIAEARMWQHAMRGGGSYEDIVGRFDDMEADPTALLASIDTGDMTGRMSLRAFTGKKGMEGIAGAKRPSAYPVRPMSDAIGQGEKYNPFFNRAVSAWRDWNRATNLQESGSFAAQQYAAASVDTGAMHWSFLNDIKGALMEFIGGSTSALQQLMQRVDSIQPPPSTTNP